MKSNFYEKLYSTEDKNKKILMDKMSKILDESISECIDLRERQKKENKEIEIEYNSMRNKIKNRHNCQRNSRIERIRNMFLFLEEDS